MSGSIIGGVVGATIGFFVGGPAGALQGFAIGSAAGGILMPGELPSVEGPRLSDLRVQASEYGRPIPIIYGTVGLQGNVIWAANLQEVATETEQGGKGGPSQTTTNYSYYGNFAVAVCEGPVENVLRIWAGPEKRLIYDGFLLEGGTIRIYTGTEDQMPDPLIEQYEGAGQVPAYRGTCYVVFEGFPLANDGNRLPFLTFEVSTGGHTCGDNFEVLESGDRLYDPAPLHVSTHQADTAYGRAAQDPQTGFLYYLRKVGSTIYLDKTDPVNMAFVETLEIGPTTTYPIMAFSETLRQVAVLLSWGGDDAAYVDVDAWTVETVTLNHAKADLITVNGEFAYLNMQNYGDADDWGRQGAVFGGYLIDCDGTVAAVSNSQALTLGGATIAASLSIEYDVFDPIARRLISFNDSAYYDLDTGVLVTVATPFGPTVNNVIYNPYVRRIFATDGPNMYMINPADITPELMPIECTIFSNAMAYSAAPEDSVKWHFSTLPAVLPTRRNYMAFIDRIANTEAGGDVFLFKVGSEGEGMALMDIVADLSDRAGMTSYDVSELTDIVDGYAIAKQTDVRSAIDVLRPAYFFDAVESQGVVRFVKRGGAVAATIPDEDLGAFVAGGEPVEPLETVRKQEVELPRTVNVSYMLAATEYEAATKTARRLIGSSLDESTLEMPLVLSDTKAQEVAEVNLHAAWAQRLSYSFSLPVKYANLEPTDLVVVKGHLMRITKVSASPLGVLKVSAVSDDSHYYEPHVIVTETEPPIKNVYIPGDTTLELM